MNQIPMAVYTFFFISFSWIQNCPVGQHGPPFIRDIQKISVAFPALRIFKCFIGVFTAFFPVIGPIGKMNKYIFDAVDRLCIEEIYCILGGRQMAVHAIGDKSLGIVYMGRCLPGVYGRLNLMAGGAESGR
jgi:hypothetical protein